MTPKILYTLSLLFVALLFVASLSVGVANFHWADLLSGSLNDSSQVLMISRLPRTFAIVLVGASMAVAGMIMQILLKNRFVEPSMVGASQSAALARRLPPSAQLLVPLVGIIFGGVIDAVATFIAYETEMLQMLNVWQSGDFSGVLLGRYELLWATGALAAFAYVIADQLTIMGLGESVAANLGLNRDAVLWAGLLIVSLIMALVVVTVGSIPFIGLVVPNIASRLLGDKLRASLPAVALLGAALVLACDLIGRLIVFPFEIPVATVFGVVGTVLFLLLLRAPQRG